MCLTGYFASWTVAQGFCSITVSDKAQLLWQLEFFLLWTTTVLCFFALVDFVFVCLSTRFTKNVPLDFQLNYLEYKATDP